MFVLIAAARFLAELFGLAALGYWGATASVDGQWRFVLAVGAPVVLAAVWGIVVAPKAVNPIPRRVREVIGSVLLLGAAVALAVTGQPAIATVFAVVVLADQVLILVLDPGTSLDARFAGRRA